MPTIAEAPMSKLMLALLALALAAPLAGLAVAAVVAPSSQADKATATDVDRAIHAAMPMASQVNAAGLRTGARKE